MKMMARGPRLQYLVLGHVCLDRLGDGSLTLGGSVYYAAAEAARQACNTIAVTLGTKTIIDKLRRSLPVNAQLRAREATSDITFSFTDSYEEGPVACEATGELLSLELTEPVDVVHIAPLLPSVEPSAWETARSSATLLGVSAQGLLRKVGCDGRIKNRSSLDLHRILMADVVIVNEREYRTLAATGLDLEYDGILVVTQGRNGATLFRDRLSERISYIPDRVTPSGSNTIGAGDTFAAAFLLALGSGASPEDSLHSAGRRTLHFLDERERLRYER